MMKWRAIGLLLLLPVSQAHAYAEPKGWLENSKDWVQQLWRNDARQWLERIDSAVLNNNYKGVIVLAQGPAVESFSVDHRMNKGVETLRMRTLSGTPKELVKKGGRFQTDAQARQGRFSAVAAPEQTTFSQFANAADNKWYKSSLAGKSRVAERPAQVIDIKAEDKWRYSYRLWLDEETGLPLRVVTLDERGSILEQLVFTQIQISPAAYKSVPKKRAGMKELGNPFKDVKGFKLIAREKQGNSRHFLYSDGLSSVSLYVEPSPAVEKARMNKDAVNGLVLGNGKTRYVALGKVPFGTLERFLAAAGGL
jgi:sigma-E factor negative regulatory protein RseB